MRALPSLSGLILVPLSGQTIAYACFAAHRLGIIFLFRDPIGISLVILN